MIFGASLYPCIIHHHNPKSPSKNWGTFVLQPSLFLSKSSNKMFATTKKNCTDFPAKVKQEKKQKYHRHQPKNKTRSSSFFSKKKRNIIGNTRLKKQSVRTCFHVSTWIFSFFFVVGGVTLLCRPSDSSCLTTQVGVPDLGNHWMIVFPTKVVATRWGGWAQTQFKDGLSKFHLPKKTMGAKWIRFWWVLFVVTDFLSLDFGLWMFFFVLGWLEGPCGGLFLFLNDSCNDDDVSFLKAEHFTTEVSSKRRKPWRSQLLVTKSFGVLNPSWTKDGF